MMSNSKEAYIYIYRNKYNHKVYIGSRSAYKGKAEEDFNIKYFSSSKNKEFRLAMKNGELEGYIVLKHYGPKAPITIVETEAKMILAFWKKYGKENSYNRYANGKWNTGGKHFTHYVMTDEIRLKMSKSQKARIDLHNNKSEEHKRKISESNKGKHNHNGKNNPFYGNHSQTGDKNPAFGKHWYTNGKDNIFTIECPEGYKPGITRNKP